MNRDNQDRGQKLAPGATPATPATSRPAIPPPPSGMNKRQKLPTPSDNPIVHHLVVEDIHQRLSVGIETYGQPLQPHNGRDALIDAYQEALDLACYLRQTIYERDGK